MIKSRLLGLVVIAVAPFAGFIAMGMLMGIGLVALVTGHKVIDVSKGLEMSITHNSKEKE